LTHHDSFAAIIKKIKKKRKIRSYLIAPEVRHYPGWSGNIVQLKMRRRMNLRCGDVEADSLPSWMVGKWDIDIPTGL
jgi:hypothetical protein